MHHPKTSSPSLDASVVVTPLEPPFAAHDVVHHFHFEAEGKILVVSDADGKRLMAMLQDQPVGRLVVLEPCGNDVDIRVSVVQ